MLLVVVLQLPLAVCTLFLLALKSYIILYRLCFIYLFICFFLFANEPAERRRSAGEAAENSAARRMAYTYAKKFSIEL